MMKEGGREILRVVRRVVMLPCRQGARDKLSEGRTVKQSLAQPIERRGEGGNARGEQEASRSRDTMGFLQSREPIHSLGQVIQRTKHEHHIAALVRALEAARVTDLYTGKGSVWLRRRSLPRQFDMQGSRIDEMPFIPLFRQPAGVHTRTTTDIDNHRRERGYVPHHQVLGPPQLNLPRP